MAVRLLVLLFPFIVITGGYLIYHQEPFLLVHPNEGVIPSRPNLTVYDDSPEKGKSRVAIVKNKSDKLSYKYTLSNAFLNPYVSVEYSPEEGKFFDLSEYDYVKLKVKASHGKRIVFCIATPKEGDMSQNNGKDKPKAFRPMTAILNVTTHYQDLIIPMKQFATPEWWYIQTKSGEKEMNLPDYSRVGLICFENCIAIKPGIEDVVELEEIGFYKDYKVFYMSSVFGLLFYLSIAGLLLYKNKKGPEVNFQQGKFISDIPLSKEEETVFEFITSHYMEQELSLSDISKASGYPESKIVDSIKGKTGMNFKAFLNKLRITEAKRLLLETDFNISEIAEKVGYRSIANFNRVFKLSEECSPNEYKKEHKSLSYQSDNV